LGAALLVDRRRARLGLSQINDAHLNDTESNEAEIGLRSPLKAGLVGDCRQTAQETRMECQ